MPKKLKKHTQQDSQEDLLATIRQNLITLSDPDTSEEDCKSIVCTFFREGGHYLCRGCHQPTELFEECKELYQNNIRHRPMELWNDTFNKVTVRPMVSFSEIHSVGHQCDTCHISDKCPFFRPMSACSIDWGSNAPTSAKDGLLYLVQLQYQRVQRATIIETTEGGVPDGTLSSEIDRLSSLLSQLSDVDASKFSLKIEASQQGTQSGGGVLAQLFGGMNNKPAIEQPQVIQVPVVEETKIKIPDSPKKINKGKK